MRTLLTSAVLQACFFICDYCHQERWQPAPFITADSLLPGRNRISMIVGSWNSLCDLRNDRGAHFSALFWSPPGHTVRFGGCDGLHKEWLSEWPQCDPGSVTIVAPSNLCSYWPVLKTGKPLYDAQFKGQRAAHLMSSLVIKMGYYKTYTFKWGSLI